MKDERQEKARRKTREDERQDERQDEEEEKRRSRDPEKIKMKCVVCGCVVLTFFFSELTKRRTISNFQNYHHQPRKQFDISGSVLFVKIANLNYF